LLRHAVGTAEKAEINLTGHGKQAITRPFRSGFFAAMQHDCRATVCAGLGGAALLETALGHSKVANKLTMNTQQGASSPAARPHYKGTIL
jgi:hypothetical protein